MTARFSLVFENPETIFSTSLFAFSLINRPSRVKKPVWLAEHLNPEPAGRESEGAAADRFGGNWKRRPSGRGGGEGLARSER